MAKIKTKKYEFDKKEIEVNFNCSSSGVFSTNLPRAIQEKLGLDIQIVGNSLKEIEGILDQAFLDYKNARTSYRLLIAICFGANGDFTKNQDNTYNLCFDKEGGRYKLNGFFYDMPCIGIDYSVIIEENRDGRIYYHSTIPKGTLACFNNSVTIGNYVSTGGSNYMAKKYKLIEFSEAALKNLNSIKEQLRRASAFLIELLTSDKMEIILSNGNFKLLNE